MKDPLDQVTGELELPKRGRGRPSKYATAAEKQAAYRSRKGTQVALLLDPEVADLFEQYMQRQAMDGAQMTKSQVVEKLIRSQLLRKR